MYDPAAGFADKVKHPKVGLYKRGSLAGKEMAKMLSVDLDLLKPQGSNAEANANTIDSNVIFEELMKFVVDSDATFNINPTTLAGNENRFPNEPDHITIDELVQGNWH